MAATPAKVPKKEEDVKPVCLGVKKEAGAVATATAPEVKAVKVEAKETVATAVKKEEPVKVASGCFGGGCA